MSSPLISLCFIARDEQELLPRALANWRDLADELVIVDTGSSDNTVAIAEAHGAKVLHYEWIDPGHKGEARNVGIDAASGDWIVVQDCDEIIEKPAELRRWLAGYEGHGVHVQFFNVEPDNHVSLIWNQMRVFRRGSYRYVHREHEIPVPTCKELDETVVDFRFIHRQPPERKQTKNASMLNRLLLDAKERPDDDHVLYFLHRQYAYTEDWDKAIEIGQQYLRNTNLDKSECYGYMAIAHEAKGESYLALQYLHRALCDQPYRRIWWSRIAELYMQAGQWNIAMGYLHGALEMWRRPEQHLNPDTDLRIYQLIDHCQAEIAHAAAAHSHSHNGEHTHGE